jgi:peptidoglycan-associated lipoprotein
MKFATIAAVAAVLTLAACADDPQPEAQTGNTGTAGAGGPAAGSQAEFTQVVGDRVFFATDQHTLDSAARSTLTGLARWLQQYGGYNVTVEGHADERGTRQYNLALGARRANSARQFLVSQGVPANRLRAVSLGKERPVSLCSNESCWSQNRRSVSVLSGAPSS